MNGFVPLIQHRASRDTHRLAFRVLSATGQECETATYGELYGRALAMHKALAGIRRGDRVLLLFAPGIDFVAALIGCWLAGAVAVPTYVPTSRRRLGRLSAVNGDAACSAVLSSANLVAKFGDAIRESGIAIDLRVAQPGIENRDDRSVVLPGLDDVALLQYTSGSTGAAKGVVLSHDNIVENSKALARAFGYTRDSHCFSWLPPYHDMGLIGCILQPIHGGFPCTLMAPTTFMQHPRLWLEGISASGATLSGAPDFAYELCVRRLDPEVIAGLDLRRWRVAFSGAEPVRLRTLERFAAAFAPAGFSASAFLPCYGLAESTLFVTAHERDSDVIARRVDRDALEQHQVVDATEGDRAEVVVSCGRSADGQRIAIVDPQSRMPLAGSVGEIWISSRSCARGYWGQPDLSQATFRAELADGSPGTYLRSGDLGFLSDDRLFITGRLKEVLIIRGRNHYPQAIEDAVAESGGLHAEAIIAVSVLEEGEERLLVVIEAAKALALPPVALLTRIRAAVAAGHDVNIWRFIVIAPHSMPRTTSGKKQRGEMKRRYVERQGAMLEWPARERVERRGCDDDIDLSVGEQEWLRVAVARQTGVSADAIRTDVPLGTYGLDSLIAAEMAAQLETKFGRAVSGLDLLSDVTIADLLTRAPQAVLAPTAPLLTTTPLSATQQALLAAGELTADTGINIAQAFRVARDIDVSRIEWALRLVIARHAALRTVLRGRYPSLRQETLDEVPFTVRDRTVADANAATQAIAQSAWVRRDRETTSALHADLIRDPDAAYLVLALDHLFVDLASAAIVVKDFKTAYETGRLPPAGAGTAFELVTDVAKKLSGKWGDDARQAWATALREPIGEIAIPFERAVADRDPLREAGFVRAHVDALTTTQLRSLARNNRATLFMVLLAGLARMARTLGRCGTRGRVGVAIPIHGRQGSRYEETVGYFVNIAPVLLEIAAMHTAADTVTQVRASVLHAMRWQYLPLAEIAAMARELHGTAAPVADVFATLYRHGAVGHDVVAGMLGDAMPPAATEWLQPYPVGQHLTQYRLGLHFVESEAGIEVAVEFDRGRLTPLEADAIAALLTDTLQQMAAVPDRRLADGFELPPLHRAVIDVANATARPSLRRGPLHALFDEAAARTPERDAVVFGEVRLTYRELKDRTDHLARMLIAAGAGPDQRVAVLMDRSTELVVALLGILKAGAAYVPLGTDYPEARLNTVIKDAKPVALITQPHLAGRVRTWSGPLFEVPAGWGAETPLSLPLPLPQVHGDNLAYVIYTSGSTGQPKGAMNSHRGICNRLLWMQDAYGLAHGDRVLQKTPYTFDVSVWEFFWPLIAGATLVVAPPDTHKDSRALCRLIAAHRITTVHFVPSMLQLFVEEPEVVDCATLRLVICSGEALPQPLANRFHRCLDAELHNLYGPTEAAVDVTAWASRRDAGLATVPIGRPIANIQTDVLDADGRPCPLGVIGQLHLSGDGLARGYCGAPARTAEVFVPASGNGKSGARCYRTGDLARWRAEGCLEFIGRADGQVKLRGHRIELAEVEHAIRQHPDVAECVVLLERDGSDDPLLAGYVVGRPGRSIAAASLRTFLRGIVPEWMLPARVVELAALPLGQSGKADRAALRQSRTTVASPNTRESTPAEALLQRLWADVLNLDMVAGDANFFDLGGHSLSALRLRARLEEHLGVDVPLRVLLDGPTIGQSVTELIAHLARERGRERGLALIAEVESMPPASHDASLQAAASFFEARGGRAS
jgi:amino acid adenylation domain-containing protein